MTAFPIVLKRRGEPEPDARIFYTVAANGIFQVRSTPFYRARTRVLALVPGLLAEAERVELDFPRLPRALLEEVLAFFRAVYRRDRGEAIAVLFYDPDAKTFRVEVPVGTRRLGEQQGVDIRNYRVIYDCCDDIRQALSGLLSPEERIEARATVEVRQVFRVSKAGMVAGSFVSDGVVNRNHRVKIIRDGAVIREGCKFASLKHFKDDVKEVRAGMECGLRLEGYDDVHVGDILETYEIVEIARTL